MGIKLKDSVRNEYLEFQMKIMLRFCVNAVISVAAVIVLYLFLWRHIGTAQEYTQNGAHKVSSVPVCVVFAV